MTDPSSLSLAAQVVLNAYRDLSWTPDKENNGKYYKFSHRAGMAAALRVISDFARMDQPLGDTDTDAGVFAAHQAIASYITAIADELEGT